MNEATVHSHPPAPPMTQHVVVEDHAASLARRLADRLARAGHHSHELRLARALMLDVIELLENVSVPL